MAILERIRGDGRGRINIERARQLLPMDLPGLRAERGIGSVASDAATLASGAAARAGETAAWAGDTIGKAGQRAGDTVARAGDAATRVGQSAMAASGSMGQDLARVAGELKLDERIDDVVRRLRRETTPGRFAAVVARLERELPDTDRDRYDRAFARGWIRARSSFTALGALLGLIAGVAGALLLDPERGRARRAAIAARAEGIGRVARHRASEQAEWLGNRVRGMAIERGLARRDGQHAADGSPRGVMDPDVMGASRRTASDTPADGFLATDRSHMPLPSGVSARPQADPEDAGVPAGLTGRASEASDPSRFEPMSANTGVATATGEPEAADATVTGPLEDDRGTWHRNL